MKSDELIAIASIKGLPPVKSARLPEMYALARKALEKCDRTDECKEWGDRMIALASYARQQNDGELVKMAMRIQARAARRVGELLAKIRPGKTGPNGKKLGSGAATQLLTRGEAARDAGLSKDQQVRAMRVAKIPEAEFDALVDSDDPPSVSELADGKRRRDPREFFGLPGAPDGAIAAATRALGLIRHMQRDGAALDFDLAVQGMPEYELTDALATLDHCERILARFRQSIQDREKQP